MAMDTSARTAERDKRPPISDQSHPVTLSLLQSQMILPPIHPGTVGHIDRFEILKPLREGGMGQVMLAREPVTGGNVAIKLIRPEYVKNKAIVDRFLNEARHMYRMSHPNILKVLEVSDRPQCPYYVMPFIQSGSLADRLGHGKILPKEAIVHIARQVADALCYAHNKGIIHRDLKPDNILVDADDRAFLTDFGLIRTVFNDPDVNVQHREITGTLPYISPGIANGQAEDTRCDIYSFGALLYEMLTGVHPYQGENDEDVLHQIQTGPPRPIRELNPNAPVQLVRIAEGAMARDLRDRYSQMLDIIKDLDRIAAGKHSRGPHERAANVKKIIPAFVGVFAVVIAGGVWVAREGRIPITDPRPRTNPPAAALTNRMRVLQRETMLLNLEKTIKAGLNNEALLKIEEYEAAFGNDTLKKWRELVKNGIDVDTKIAITAAAKTIRNFIDECRFKEAREKLHKARLKYGEEAFREVTKELDNAEKTDEDNKKRKRAEAEEYAKEMQLREKTRLEAEARLKAYEARLKMYLELNASATTTAATNAAQPEQPPPPMMGGLYVETEPSGALVSAGPHGVGRSPVTFTNVPAGELKIRIDLENYEPIERIIEVSKNDFKTLTEKMAKLKGKVEVTSVPGGAEILVDDEKTLQKTPAMLEMDVGDHTISLCLHKYKRVSKSVKVERDREARLAVDLEEVFIPRLTPLAP